MDLSKILEAIDKVKGAQHGDLETAILAKSVGNTGFVRVGNLFGVDVYSTDTLPQDIDLMVVSKKDLEINGVVLDGGTK